MQLSIGTKLKKYLRDKLIDFMGLSNSGTAVYNYNPLFFEKNKNQAVKLFQEPETLAQYRLKNEAKDIGADKAIKLYNSHIAKVNNQWVNALQSINTGYGTAQYSFYNYQTVNYYECYVLAQDPIMNNIFDILSSTSLSKGGNLTSDKTAEEISLIEKQANKYKLDKMLKQALRSSFVSGGCLIYLDFGLNNLEEPLDLKKINFKRFRGFRQIDPINITAVKVNTINPAENDYMEPESWYVIGLGIVHKSHFLKFTANEPEKILKPLCLYFGMPLTQLLKRDVANTTLASQGLANLLNRFRYLYLKTNHQNFTGNNAIEFMKRLESMSLMQENYGFWALDRDEDVIQLTTSLTGMGDNIEIFFQILCSITGIPLTKLLGKSAAGLNATGEGDRLNFYDKIKTVQQDVLKNNLLKMYSIINATLAGEYEEFEDYIFNPLEEANEKEKGDLIKSYIEAGRGLVELGAKQEDVFNWMKNNKQFSLDGVEFDADTAGLLDYEDENNGELEDITPKIMEQLKSNNEFKESEHPRDEDGKFAKEGDIAKSKEIKITGKELGDYKDIKELRQKAVEYYKEKLQGKTIENPELGKVLFSRTGLNKFKTTSVNENKLKMVVALEDIIKNGNYQGSEKIYKKRDDGIIKFHRINHNVDLDEKEYKTSILIGEDKNGNRFYNLSEDYENYDNKKKKLPGYLLDRKQTKEASNNSINGIKDNIAENFGEVNIFFEDEE